jgi:hypothetical protein
MREKYMRTTIIPKDDLVNKAKKLSDWIAQPGRKELKARLVEEYRSGRQEAGRTSQEFAHVDKEGWPSW